jgi:hypothetical protein
MYRHLWTIGPKEAIESMDYSFKDHFGKDLPSFVPRDIIRLYLEGIFHHRNNIPRNEAWQVFSKMIFK